MTTKNNLYILHHSSSRDKIYAISEHEEFIAYYLSLFDNYFINKSNYTLSITSDTLNLPTLADYQLFPIGIKNKFVLTEWEWRYYQPYFRELYTRAKETIINLRMFEEIYGYQSKKDQVQSSNMFKSSHEFYTISSSFEVFVENLPINFIKEYIMDEPLVAHKCNAELEALYDKYRMKLYNN